MAKPKQKTVAELREELRVAEAAEAQKVAMETGILQQFIDNYEDKYFWTIYKHQYSGETASTLASIVHLFDFHISEDGDGKIKHKSEQIWLMHHPKKYRHPVCYGKEPQVRYDSDHYCSINTYDLPSHLFPGFRPATKADFVRLYDHLQQFIADSLRLFSGEIPLPGLPDIEPPDRLLTLGKL